MAAISPIDIVRISPDYDREQIRVEELATFNPTASDIGVIERCYGGNQDTYNRQSLEAVEAGVVFLQRGDVYTSSKDLFVGLLEILAAARNQIAREAKSEGADDFGVLRKPSVGKLKAHQDQAVAGAGKMAIQFDRSVADDFRRTFFHRQLQQIGNRALTFFGERLKKAMQNKTGYFCSGSALSRFYAGPLGPIASAEELVRKQEEVFVSKTGLKIGSPFLAIGIQHLQQFYKSMPREMAEQVTRAQNLNPPLADRKKSGYVIGCLALPVSPDIWKVFSTYVTWYDNGTVTTGLTLSAIEKMHEDKMHPDAHGSFLKGKASQIIVIHPDSAFIDDVFTDLSTLFSEALRIGREDPVRLKSIQAQMYFTIAHLMPWKNGTAAINSMLEKVIYKYCGYRLTSYAAGNNPDQEAFSNPDLSEFIQNYPTLFQRDPTSIKDM